MFEILNSASFQSYLISSSMAITGGVTTSAEGISGAQIEQVDANHPLYIHPSETQGFVLVSTQLLRYEVYSLWSKAMCIVLLGKNKLGLLLGTCRKDMYPTNLYNLRDRCNSIVLAWIMNTVSKDLISTVIYGFNAHKVWIDLRERIDKVHASRAFYLHKEIITLTQGTSYVSSYFSKLRELWDELEALVPPLACLCPKSKEYTTHFQLQKLWQFLIWLNESYAYAKSQISMIVPLTNINQAYTMILNVASQSLIEVGSHLYVPTAGDLTALIRNRLSSKFYQNGNSSTNYSGSYSGSISGHGGGNNSYNISNTSRRL